MRAKRTTLNLEFLERRDAPATFVSPTKMTYQDTDGDNVTVTFSKPILTASNFNSVFLFNVPSVLNASRQQLQTIDLAAIGASANGTAIAATAVHSPVNGGDNTVNIGFINAAGIDLGSVNIAGDLGQIDAGDGNAAAPAIPSLVVRSMGRFGLDTQAPGGNFKSDINGALG